MYARIHTYKDAYTRIHTYKDPYARIHTHIHGHPKP
jgi:hypothetical protein